MSETENTSIPAAAIEAAARVILQEQRPNRPWDEWAPDGQEMWKDIALAALCAAAPYMLVSERVEAKGEAWVEALEWADERGYLIAHVDSCSNPYRPAA